MEGTTRVNFHCHSYFSHDADLAPEVLAEKMAAAGVQYAALTDHDSVDGLSRFQEILKRRGTGYISGVELTSQYDGKEIHLLGYGFDPAHPALQEVLISLRQTRDLGVHRISSSLMNLGRPANGAGNGDDPGLVQENRIDLEDAIRVIHQAGGKVFLAHPLMYASSREQLDQLIGELKQKGLDGLEVFYTAFSNEEIKLLWELSCKHHLLTSAGSDVHRVNQEWGVDMPTKAWKEFRDSILHTSSFAQLRSDQSFLNNQGGNAGKSAPKPAFTQKSFILRIFFPAILAIFLFIAAIWGVILPSLERTLVERKRELIKELTNSAWSILASYERDERLGKLSRVDAQEMAKSRIEALRYGSEGKDYFWLQDMHPTMIMHPYRPDLNGQDVSQFTDPRGVRIFAEFADLVRRKNEGYIDYVWQWKDDPQRLEPKQSYIKGFEPWGWVIGTGLYIDDVNAEIARLEQNFFYTLAGISGVVILLLLFIVQQSLRIERERIDAEANLRESNERYRSLVEATTEGALLILGGRCRYANPTLLRIIGYTLSQVELLDLNDLLPQGENQTIWELIQLVSPGTKSAEGVEGALRARDGSLVECVLAVNPIEIDGVQGIILLAKNVEPAVMRFTDSEADRSLQDNLPVGWQLPVGVFQARASRRAVLTRLNPALQKMLIDLHLDHIQQPALADFFTDMTDFQQMIDKLLKEGSIKELEVHVETIEAGSRSLSLSASLVRDDEGHPLWIEGMLQDVTPIFQREAEREALIEKLQSSLLFLQEPVERLGKNLVVLDVHTPVQKAARLITANSASAAIVALNDGTPVGMVTDHDLRERVLAEGLDPQTPIRLVMSAPLVTISEKALIFEALMRMEEKGIQCLAVEDEQGKVVNILRYKEMVQFHRYGSLVMTNEISRASSPETVIQACQRLPTLVCALVNVGAQPRSITRMISLTCDAAVQKFIQFAIADLGQPPLPFAFLAMGSQGRQEQTLLTDQDNAIIIQDPEHAEEKSRVEQYFLRLGEAVVNWLDQAGFPLCQGKMMANNPRWCRPLSDWKLYFKEWILKAEPQELLEFSIFFDFRSIYGSADLTNDLRQFIFQSVNEYPPFFLHFAKNALLFAPPTRLFGRIYLSGGSMEHEGYLNLKDAMMAIGNFARLYALRHRIHAVNTLERIDALVEKNVLLPASRDEITAAYNFLMQLRLRRQVERVTAGKPLDNMVQIARLSHHETALLQQAYAQITAVQKKISYDFFGGS